MSNRLRARRRLPWLLILLALVLLCGLLSAFVYNLPFVHERLEWRLANLRAQIWYAFFPPEEAVFTPNPTVAAMVQFTLTAVAPSSTPSPTPGPSATPTLTPTPTEVPTPIPDSVQLTGVRHEYQQWNNCGPANLSMALSFWGWQGDQRDTAAVLKPNPRDKNVMPYEMAAYVNEHTGLRALTRVGGDLELLRRLIAAGFPVLVEKGMDEPAKGWFGHYQLLVGYDDGTERFSAYDSYEGDFSSGRTLPVPYDRLEAMWRHFNFTYLVVYPPDREAEVLALLGPFADEVAAYQAAADRASYETIALSGRDQYFAWFNRGSSLVLLQDYAGAAAAYDTAFQLYAQIPSDERPWRLRWYQTGPYWAYYYTGRYYDVINLATMTLEAMDEPILEESYYWRALARLALGDTAGAVEDLRTSLEVHPGFEPSLTELQLLGLGP